jgi:Uncharacterised nucleotidyltransferase
MRVDAPPLGRWPTREQEVLLRAAFLPEHEALRSWRELAATTTVEEFQGSSHCLLPLVYHNLQGCGGVDDGLQKLKGTYRYVWYKNVARLEQVSGLLGALRAHGVEALIRRDAALILRYYVKPGLREIDGIHLLIRPGEVVAATKVLQEAGWNPLVQPQPSLLRWGTSLQFTKDSREHVVLSWRTLRPTLDDNSVWSTSEGISIGEEQAHVAGATDALLDSCAFGIGGDAASPAQRMADAAAVLSSAGHWVDWDRLVVRAGQSATVLSTYATLSYLCQVVRAPVPDHVLGTMATIAPSTLDRLESAAPPGATDPLTACRIHWHRYRRYGGAVGRGSSPFAFPRYIQATWGHDRTWKAAMHVGHTLVRTAWSDVSKLGMRRA